MIRPSRVQSRGTPLWNATLFVGNFTFNNFFIPYRDRFDQEFDEREEAFQDVSVEGFGNIRRIRESPSLLPGLELDLGRGA